jgi:glycine/D-amino acid oxidase-like deaminating enzyme|tara:strand:+ start:79 stop:279 length:201 start_codon:yes stop_codon:yes gene_type:complete
MTINEHFAMTIDGIKADIIGPAQAQDLYPAIDQSRVAGALFIPDDGQLNPVDVIMTPPLSGTSVFN